MIKSVVSKEYQNLWKEIVQLQEKWKTGIDPDTVMPDLDKAAMAAGVPVIDLTAIDLDISLFQQWVEDINSVLIKARPDLESMLSGISSLLDKETVIRWIENAQLLNMDYFRSFAEEHGLEEWIPQFLAEMIFRPYLQMIAGKVQDSIEHTVPWSGCPVCGEPVRMAVLEEDGKKVCQCPRCLAQWKAKRLECSHCGNEDYQKIKFFSIEGDAVSQIQVCEECNGYIKIIDTRQYIEKPSAAMIDLISIHLDFVAQENGFSAVGEKKVTN